MSQLWVAAGLSRLNPREFFIPASKKKERKSHGLGSNLPERILDQKGGSMTLNPKPHLFSGIPAARDEDGRPWQSVGPWTGRHESLNTKHLS